MNNKNKQICWNIFSCTLCYHFMPKVENNYIDNTAGDNTNRGTRIKRAWAIIDKIRT
jgi:pyruvate/2-oxoacid:ferredoxin oxidoreductase beta subunit